jgi:hypothetical protein
MELGEKKNSKKEEEKGPKLVNTKKPYSTPNLSWIELVALPLSILNTSQKCQDCQSD